MPKSKPWEETWADAEAMSGWRRSGGQGKLKLVQRRDDPNIYVLKELKNQRDPERRARMRREIVTLETFPNPSTPIVFDHNTQEFADRSIDMFAVLEFIDGRTVGEFITDDGPVDQEKALGFIEMLLDVLNAYHGNGIGHRDIKPDNIVLRGDDLGSPVLVDFGLSFNSESETEEITPSAQQVGNRFLILPEHSSTSGNKRDLRSDISFCVGMLFYVLTGIFPSTLVDEENRPPHQRVKARDLLNKIPERERLHILQIFDQGFSASIAHRWQSISALKMQLERIGKQNEDAESIDDVVQSLREKAAAVSGNQQIINALNRVRDGLHRATHEAVSRLGSGYRPSIGSRVTNMRSMNTWTNCAIDYTFGGHIVETPFLISAVGNEVIVEQLFGDRRETKARVPIQNPDYIDQLHEQLVGLIIANVGRKLRQGQ